MEDIAEKGLDIEFEDTDEGLQLTIIIPLKQKLPDLEQSNFQDFEDYNNQGK